MLTRGHYAREHDTHERMSERMTCELATRPVIQLDLQLAVHWIRPAEEQAVFQQASHTNGWRTQPTRGKTTAGGCYAHAHVTQHHVLQHDVAYRGGTEGPPSPPYPSWLVAHSPEERSGASFRALPIGPFGAYLQGPPVGPLTSL